MDRLKNRLMLAALCIALAVHARAADRVDASEWLELSFKDELDRPKTLWCRGRKACSPAGSFSEAADSPMPLYELKLSYSQEEASAGTVAYFESTVSEYTAIRRGEGFAVSKAGSAMSLAASYGPSNSFHYPPQTAPVLDLNSASRGPARPIVLPARELVLNRPYKAMVVADPAGRAAPTSNPMDGLGARGECRDLVSYYYGKDGAALTGSQLVHRRLLPQEIEFTEAGLPGLDLKALRYGDAMDAGAAGRLGEVDSFVKSFRAAARSAAQSASADSSAPAERFTPFEAGFLSCRTEHAGTRAAFFSAMRALTPAQTPAFVAKWRGFARRELQIYLDGSADGKIPAGPAPYKDALDLTNARTVSTQGGFVQPVASGPRRGPADDGKLKSILDQVR